MFLQFYQRSGVDLESPKKGWGGGGGGGGGKYERPT